MVNTGDCTLDQHNTERLFIPSVFSLDICAQTDPEQYRVSDITYKISKKQKHLFQTLQTLPSQLQIKGVERKCLTQIKIRFNFFLSPQ